MRYILTDVYEIIYRFIKNKVIADIIAVFYVSFLSLTILHAICSLMYVYISGSITHFLFSFPYSIFLFIVMFFIHFAMMPSQYVRRKDKHRTNRYTFMIVYTIAAIISFLFIKYGDLIRF